MSKLDAQTVSDVLDFIYMLFLYAVSREIGPKAQILQVGDGSEVVRGWLLL